MTAAATSSVETRRVGLPLLLGVLLLPYIFVWFLLGQGYSSRARLFGFGWLIVLAVAVMQAGQGQSGGLAADSNAPVVAPVDPARREKDEAAALARVLVPRTMKDPSSAQFGNVWGMASGIACGFVNGKNSFGAMAGQQRFIMVNGAVEFEGGERFAHHWNSLCVDKLLSSPPEGAMGMRWGGRATSALKAFMPPTEGLSLYVPKVAPGPLEGVAVKEADARFDHGRLYAVDFYIDGQAQRDAIRAALVKKFGPPISYDETASSYSWEWPKRRVTVEMSYDEGSKRTIVTYAHGNH